jgi:hypothetical protein
MCIIWCEAEQSLVVANAAFQQKLPDTTAAPERSPYQL